MLSVLFWLWVAGACGWLFFGGVLLAYDSSKAGTNKFKPQGFLMAPFWPFILVGSVVGGLLRAIGGAE